ncbi:MAG TPA: hypothetical protein VKI44_02415 [Acetobacteraceae bacterium]|nr:hypothetical protein [Acetobacteraceae bacterium]
METERARAKAMVLKWFDGGAPEPRARRQLSTGIDRFFDEISKRSAWSECLSTMLGDESTPAIRASGANWRARPCRDGLAVSSVVPGWGFGWSKILQEAHVYQVLSWLGHYAQQYIHRSNIAKVLMIGWEQHGVVLHPFGSGGMFTRYGAVTGSVTPRQALDWADSKIDETWGPADVSPTPSKSRWRSRNTLDPAIHQGIFHFLRAQSLAKAEFELEALAAFDCVLQSLQAMDWSWAPGNPHRSRVDLCCALGFGNRTAALAEHVYFLRNQFVAHAGGWRWWDAVEYLDDGLVDSASKLASRALGRAADLETQHRRIDPAPSNWTEWLLRHFGILWESVWFRDPAF